MIDGISFDQLRTFIVAVEEGSFSAAGRRLNRAQSVVSQTLANLEAQLGIRLFDRDKRYPVLTAAGQALLADARSVAVGIDLLKARARGIAGGLEPELHVVVDVMFPMEALTCAVVAFQEAFPATPLRLNVEALGAVVEPVLDGTCAFGVMGSLPDALPQLTREWLLSVRLVTVAAPTHPLASCPAPIPASRLAQHTQLVLTDRSSFTAGREFGVVSPRTWRLADLGAKHMFLRAGLGWGGMPHGVVAPDLASGALVQLVAEGDLREGHVMPMSASYRTDTPPGPAGRWLIDRLKRGPASHIALGAAP
jgi:DNA-binding transcriptional LysR family regulator